MAVAMSLWPVASTTLQTWARVLVSVSWALPLCCLPIIAIDLRDLTACMTVTSLGCITNVSAASSASALAAKKSQGMRTFLPDRDQDMGKCTVLVSWYRVTNRLRLW